MEQFCRICLTFYPNRTLLDASVCWEYFDKIAGLPLNELPYTSYLCCTCVHKMRKALRFRNVVQFSNAIFKRFQAESVTGKSVDWKCISVENLRLDTKLTLAKIQCIEFFGVDDDKDALTEKGIYYDLFRDNLKVELKEETDDLADDGSVMADVDDIIINDDPIKMLDAYDSPDDDLPLSNRKRKSRKDSADRLGRSRNSKKPKVETDDEKFTLVLLSRDEQIAEMTGQASKKTYVFAAFKCKRCFASFATESMYSLHMSRHENVTDHFCDVCHCYFRSSHHLYQHTNLVHKKRYQCVLCEFRRKDKTLIIEHYNLEHAGLKNNTVCSVCGKSFRKESSLKRHICNQEKVKCHLCDRYLTKLSLRQHILTHMTSEKRYECSVCQARFLRPYNLQAHEKLKHSSNRGEFYCAECDVSFKSEEILKRHLTEATRHVTEENLKLCPLCPAKLPKWGVKAHINKQHLNVREFKCDQCPKEFFNRNSMVLHRRRTHEGVKSQRRYVCETCGKAFTTKRILIDHSNMHTGLRPYRCKYCDADFGHEAARYNHTRLVHLKIKLKPQVRKKKAAKAAQA